VVALWVARIQRGIVIAHGGELDLCGKRESEVGLNMVCVRVAVQKTCVLFIFIIIWLPDLYP
jgi:hypothetical protein